MTACSWLSKVDVLIKTRVLPLGLFIQLTGIIWIYYGGYKTQIYLWCLFPGLISLCIDFYRNGLVASLRGVTIGERLIALMLLWIQIHPLLVTEGADIGIVFNRVIKIATYLYVVRTVILHTNKPERLLIFSSAVAAFFAAATLIYQFGIIGHPMGIRVIGLDGFRVSGLGIGSFTESLNNPILAALYYGVFASIICGYLTAKPFIWQRRLPAIFALAILTAFIVLSGSRGPLIAFISTIGVMLLFYQHSWRWKLISFLFITACISLIWLHDDIIEQTNFLIANGLSCRLPTWLQGVEYISQKPFLGVGAFTEFSATCNNVQIVHPHNMIIHLWYHWGLPAVIFYITIFVYILSTIKTVLPSTIATIAIAVLVFGFVGMLSDTYSFLVRPNLQWLLFFLPISIYAGVQRKKKQTSFLTNNPKDS